MDRNVLDLSLFAGKVFLANFDFSLPRVPQTHFVRFTSWYTSSKRKLKLAQKYLPDVVLAFWLLFYASKKNKKLS